MELTHIEDAWNCVHIDLQRLDQDKLNSFGADLEYSLQKWENKGIKGVWLQIPIELSQHIPTSVKAGFVFHHARPDMVMLSKWIPKDLPNTLPLYCSHSVGVGGFVVQDDKVLVVKEKNGPVTSIYKMPGGMVDPGEDIHDAVVREVHEETGVLCKFDRILCFRQNHTSNWNTSNIYVVCSLQILDASELKPQHNEISEVKWMPIDEFKKLPYYKGLYGAIVSLSCDYATGSNYNGWTVSKLPIVFRKGQDTLYHCPSFNTKDFTASL